MIIFRTILPYRKWLLEQRSRGNSIGFVPTMGALHEGHLSLLRAAGNNGQTMVCSIFVNPTQFNDPNDFKLYPVTTDIDIQQLISIGTDVLFLPSVHEMYPEGAVQQSSFELGNLETVFEGAFRPGHFQGVCQVVSRLLDIVEPDNIYMGQKDYQQCMVIARLLELKHSATVLNIMPTLRENSGLAMSSRNMRLSAEEREKATAIWRTMNEMAGTLSTQPIATLEKNAEQKLLAAGFDKVDYCTPADATTLGPWQPGTNAVILCAAFMGKVRLIDNLLVNA
ncbi:MAG: pantoate--beta-alanine ligase [Chitinophagaceae bacterium]